MKSRDGKSQRREEKKKEDQKRESLRRKKIQVREKVGKSWDTVFFQWFVAPEGRKVGSLKRRVRGQLARWDEKLHAVVARSTFPSQNVQNTPTPDHFWKLRCRKSARRCGAKHVSKSKCTNHLSFGALLEVEMSKKCTPLWREAYFEGKSAKNWGVPCTFGRSDVVSRGRRKGLCTLSKKWATRGDFVTCHMSKNDGKRGTFEEDLQRCIFRSRRSTRYMFIRDVRRSGRWFPERGCILEHQIFRFAEVILRDRCSTSYDPVSLFRGRRSSLDRWNQKSQNALARGCQLCTQLFIFEGSLAELFRFWCCQLRKMRKSRRLVSFLMLSSSKSEEVSQNYFRFWRCQRQTLK